MTHTRLPQRSGLSLLEVVLALAILAFATAYLAQSMQLATQNALQAQRLSQAELVAESVMNQVIAGVIPAQPVTWTQYFAGNGNSEWMYQLQQVPTEIENMLGIQVAVQKIDPSKGLVQTEYDLYVNRWIIDPALGLDTPPEEEEATDETSADSSSGGSAEPSGSQAGAGGSQAGAGGGFGAGFGGAGGGRGGGFQGGPGGQGRPGGQGARGGQGGPGGQGRPGGQGGADRGGPGNRGGR